MTARAVGGEGRLEGRGRTGAWCRVGACTACALLSCLAAGWLLWVWEAREGTGEGTSLVTSPEGQGSPDEGGHRGRAGCVMSVARPGVAVSVWGPVSDPGCRDPLQQPGWALGAGEAGVLQTQPRAPRGAVAVQVDCLSSQTIRHVPCRWRRRDREQVEPPPASAAAPERHLWGLRSTCEQRLKLRFPRTLSSSSAVAGTHAGTRMIYIFVASKVCFQGSEVP